MKKMPIRTFCRRCAAAAAMILLLCFFAGCAGTPDAGENDMPAQTVIHRGVSGGAIVRNEENSAIIAAQEKENDAAINAVSDPIPEAYKEEQSEKKLPAPAEETAAEVTPPAESEQNEKTETAPPEPEISHSEDTGAAATESTCTISISCVGVLSHMDNCAENIRPFVPSDGMILPTTAVSFSAGETVFHVLERTCRENGIPLEYKGSPDYGSIYVEGIANLYEKDVGSTSGWTYRVNGSFPNYGCSAYTAANGDTIEWIYICG